MSRAGYVSETRFKVFAPGVVVAQTNHQTPIASTWQYECQVCGRNRTYDRRCDRNRTARAHAAHHHRKAT